MKNERNGVFLNSDEEAVAYVAHETTLLTKEMLEQPMPNKDAKPYHSSNRHPKLLINVKAELLKGFTRLTSNMSLLILINLGIF